MSLVLQYRDCKEPYKIVPALVTTRFPEGILLGNLETTAPDIAMKPKGCWRPSLAKGTIKKLKFLEKK